MIDSQNKTIIKKLEKQLRLTYAEICYWYPQYKIEDIVQDEGLPIGDINLLIKFARKQYYQDKLDSLQIITSSQSNRSFKKAKNKLDNIIKKLEAEI